MSKIYQVITDLSTMKIDVKHVAKLANLPLSQGEEEKYSKQLTKILDYMEVLNKVDTEDVEPTSQVTGLKSVMREDETSPSLTQEEVLQNAPKKKGGYFVTKGIFNG